MEFDEKLTLPEVPAKLFLVGIGGIGMSGLAQLLRWRGYSVAGSDRGLWEAGKAEMYDALRRQGIALYPQDGSGVKAEQPDMVVVSTAVEDGNPDLQGVAPVMHRARALSQVLGQLDGRLIAVAGSCGKTSVTGWIASALSALGESVLMVNGGYVIGSGCEPGNFSSSGKPAWQVVEVDESDKSIAEFAPDYGVLLNVGNDHYDEAELRRVFSAYLGRCGRGIVLPLELRDLAEGASAPVKCFATGECQDANVIWPRNYSMDAEGIHFEAAGLGEAASCQSGYHSACNACAVLALLKSLGLKWSDGELLKAIGAFQGVRQRFEFMGKNGEGVPRVNDYAHNPEKVFAAIRTARERYGSPLAIVFQPHGFRPLEFMRDELVQVLRKNLSSEDLMIFLPVFYAGGTASFRPSSQEVAVQVGAPNVVALERAEAAERIAGFQGKKCILVMGARDSSLRGWTGTL